MKLPCSPSQKARSQLVGRLARSPAFMPALPVARQRSLGVRRGAADGVAIIGPSSPTAALAVPHEGGRLAVPPAGRLLEPDAVPRRARGVLPGEGAPPGDGLPGLVQRPPP